MPYLAKGLEDKDDVQLLAHQILAKVTDFPLLSSQTNNHTTHALLRLPPCHACIPPTNQPTTPPTNTNTPITLPNKQACRSSPQAVLGALDQLLPPLEAVANKQIKESQVGPG